MRRITVPVTLCFLLCFLLTACPPTRKVTRTQEEPERKAALKPPAKSPVAPAPAPKPKGATKAEPKKESPEQAREETSDPPVGATKDTTPDPTKKSTKPPPPTVSSTPGKVNRPKPHAVPLKDGPALSTVLTGVTSLEPASPGKDKLKVTDARVIQAVLRTLNTGQTLKGNRKGCKFLYGFLLKGARGKDLGSVALCGPVGANCLAMFSDDTTWKEWQITVPNGKALTALLDKHLPGAKAD